MLPALAAMVLYHEKMDAVKVVALFLAILSFGSYSYQNCLDQNKLQQEEVRDNLNLDNFSSQQR